MIMAKRGGINTLNSRLVKKYWFIVSLGLYIWQGQTKSDYKY